MRGGAGASYRAHTEHLHGVTDGHAMAWPLRITGAGLHGMNIREKLGTAVRAHRRLFVAVVAALSVVTWTAVGASAWFIRDIVTGLPEDGDVREIGAMAQATTLLDVHGRPAFTIFKEQRIEVPLERVSPHVIKAITAVEDQ